MCPRCLIHPKTAHEQCLSQPNAQTHDHHRTDHLCAGKNIYRLKEQLFTAWKNHLQLQKDYIWI